MTINVGTDHIGEVRLSAGGSSLEALFEDAGLRFAVLEREQIPVTPARHRCTVTCRAADREALLVEWLNSLIFLSETEAWVPDRIRVTRLTDSELEAEVSGPRLAHPPALVKAATLHGLRLEPDARGAGGWTAEVILDV